MRLEIHEKIIEQMKEKFPDNVVYEKDETSVRFSSRRTIDSKFLSEEEVAELQKIYQEPQWKEKVEDRRVLTNLNALLKLLSGKEANIKNLKTMTEALKMEIAKLPRHWVFVQDEYAEVMRPYFVTKIQYEAPRQGSEPAISFIARAMYRGAQTSVTYRIHRDDLGPKGCNASQLLENIGTYPETEELVQEHEEYIEKYQSMFSQTGLQLTGTGKAVTNADRWSREVFKLDSGGVPSKMVIDDLEERKDKDSPTVSCDLWVVKHGTDGEEADVYRLPVLPYIRTFNLKVHAFMDVHVANVEVYEYEKGLQDKLVLEDDKRELIDLLVSSGGDDSRDIVQGKSGGVIIITSGPPGVGKTLTAEVYSEKVERPLYVVQCSQLGTNPDNLEKELNTVLERAVRWNAVLLIDEADVYIHERGNDIQQNAIVGVFLRVLEYYSGVLFLTTNRECVVDDAIISRCIAHIRYKIPSQDQLVELWSILSEQYQVPFSKEMCKELAESFPHISGRSVKQLIRLSKALCSSRGEEITPDAIAWVSRFQHIELTDETKKKFPVVN